MRKTPTPTQTPMAIRAPVERPLHWYRPEMYQRIATRRWREVYAKSTVCRVVSLTVSIIVAVPVRCDFRR